MRDFLNWLLDDIYLTVRRTDRAVNWLTLGIVLGALLIWFTT